jgi:putative endonuclease
LLWNKRSTTKEIGDNTEIIARAYLEEKGLVFQCNNFFSKLGEIDLIMKDDETLVFIEVKFRSSNHFGGAISAISVKKQQKIRKTTAFYLQQSGLNEYNTACRFDVVTLQGNIDKPHITWLKNAF